jgi:hypothetical protein
MRVNGRCHCGAVAFEAEVKIDDIGICHCSDCQALSGSPFRANVAAPAAHFRILKGTPRRYIKTADSGAKRVHAFCERCGSPVYSCALDNPQSYSLRIGSLQQRHELGRPARQIWTDRRLDWVDPLEDVPGTACQP